MIWLPKLAKTFTKTKQSIDYLKDLIELVHVSIRMLDGLKKSKALNLFVAKKKRGGRKAKPTIAEGLVSYLLVPYPDLILRN